MALSPELRKYYDDLGEMFATPGWKNLVEEAKTEIYQMQADALEISPSMGSVEYALGRLQGRAETFNYFSRLEEISDVQRAALEEEARLAASEEL